MAFKIPSNKKEIPDNTLELFNELGSFESLKEEQRKVLLEYNNIKKENKDIGIELPTGAGKTLVGGLIGEFKRKSEKSRIVYCCATRQLASQTTSLLKSYGIETVLLTGKSRDFPDRDLGKYYRAESIAVTTYSHIFNTNPKFNDAELIVFDDAHATEYSINTLWNLKINRCDNPQIYKQLYSLLKDSISKNLQHKIESEMYDPFHQSIDIIPQPFWLYKIDDIKAFLNKNVNNTNLYYPWIKMRDILHACNIFIRQDQIVIMPIIPPNARHDAFSQAEERLYMSATLGEDGELERVFGVEEIKQISGNSNGISNVSGERLLLFPGDHFDKEDLMDTVAESIKLQPRSLVLCTSKEKLDKFKNDIIDKLPDYKIFLDTDIEESLEEFKTHNKAILLLAGRYEGIDLKDDECRLQIFVDIPVSIGASEQFLEKRLKATEVLRSRLASRITQGLGRSTRGEEDYAAIMFLGEGIGEHLYKDEFLKLLPPKIESEFQFSFSQNDDTKSLNEWIENLEIFFRQDEDWHDAQGYLRKNTRDIIEQREMEGDTTNYLSKIASHEVAFMYQLLDEKYEKAHATAAEILATLKRKTSYKGYRGWWNYHKACLWGQQDDKEKVNDYLQNALSASINKTWIDQDVFNQMPHENQILSEEKEIQINKMLDYLRNYGDRNHKFENDLKIIIDGISGKEAFSFEKQFEKLGSMLGFNSYRPEGKGTPDGIWESDDSYIVFEAKTNIKDSSTEIPLDDIRQTGFHGEWLKRNFNNAENKNVVISMICDKDYISSDSIHAADNIYLIHHQEVIDLVNDLAGILRETLTKLKYTGEEESRKHLISGIEEKNFFYSNLIISIKKRELGQQLKS